MDSTTLTAFAIACMPDQLFSGKSPPRANTKGGSGEISNGFTFRRTQGFGVLMQSMRMVDHSSIRHYRSSAKPMVARSSTCCVSGYWRPELRFVLDHQKAGRAKSKPALTGRPTSLITEVPTLLSDGLATPMSARPDMCHLLLGVCSVARPAMQPMGGLPSQRKREP
ncbi:hypothetical protein EKD04_025460 [Chloroflexales bacterium ZM16-3]|nr:hypothetical protein [Chloroflexales bacterium ZM16-3]